MAENTKIEWAHATFNPWRGCTKVSAGCANCYAERMSARNPKSLGVWGDNGTRAIAAESYWRLPLKWNRWAERHQTQRRVFCASLADVCEDRADLIEPRIRLRSLIQQTPNLVWLLLTKRPENYRHFFWQWDFPPNVWVGTSCENQETSNERIPHLLRVPAAVRFLSVEPLLGPIDLTQIQNTSPPNPGCPNGAPSRRVDWIIVGGESGPHARPMHPDWPRSIRDQCQAAGVPFFFKQWGEWRQFDSETDSPSDLKALYESGCTNWVDRNGESGFALGCEGREYMLRVGKKRAGRELDGRTWDELPHISKESKQ